MKKTTLLTTALLLLNLVGWSQTTENRQLDNFTDIRLSVPAKVYLTQGDYSVKLEGKDLDKVETNVQGNRLTIERESSGNWFNWNWNSDNEQVEIYISLPTLEGLRVSGSGSVQGQNTFSTTKLDIRISGSGSVKLAVEASETDVHISGSGSLNLTGISRELDASISGSGRIKAENLKAKDADIKISGSGNCHIEALNALNAQISGSGSVYYKGSPKTLNINTSGSGKVRKI